MVKYIAIAKKKRKSSIISYASKTVLVASGWGQVCQHQVHGDFGIDDLDGLSDALQDMPNHPPRSVPPNYVRSSVECPIILNFPSRKTVHCVACSRYQAQKACHLQNGEKVGSVHDAEVSDAIF